MDKSKVAVKLVVSIESGDTSELVKDLIDVRNIKSTEAVADSGDKG